MYELRAAAAEPGEGLGVGVLALGETSVALGSREEEHLTFGMRSERRAEFRLGRRAARRAMDVAGLAPAPVLASEERPLFAPHVVGTISHSNGVAIAMAGPAARYRSVGIDVEFGRLPLNAARLILGESERRVLEAHGERAAESILMTYFTAKEAAFKALDPILEGGAPALHRLRVCPCPGGHVGWSVHAPLVKCFVQTRAVTDGVLSWTVISRSDGQ